MFNDDDRVAAFHEFLEHVHEDADVFEVQSRGRFVQDVERTARVALGEFRGEFHALAFSAREGGAGLSDFNVAQSDFLKHFDFVEDVGHVFEELHGLVDGHVQHVGDALSFEAHLQSLVVVALAVAGFAGHEHIGQEVHFDGFVAVPFADLAASAFHVEGETSRFVAPHL